MVLHAPGEQLVERELPEPEAAPRRLLVRVEACAVCRTDLHVADGELPGPKLPLVLGHQVVGRVVDDGRRVGIPWLGWTDGTCAYCRSDRENQEWILEPRPHQVLDVVAVDHHRDQRIPESKLFACRAGEAGNSSQISATSARSARTPSPA